jgi:predicted SprT family Zn-dependent metalloprotease
MKLERARMLATDLMKYHMGKGNFTFQFDNAFRRFGYNKGKLISLSKRLVELNSEEEVLNTILHEIAHALTPKDHHGEAWQMKAKAIGCNGERCYSSDVVKPKAKFVGVCPGCDRKIFKLRRRKISCGKCGKGKFNSAFLFQWAENND